MKNKILLPILFFVLMSACKRRPYLELKPALFPDSPVNLSDMNSQFDDYNSISTSAGNTIPLCFSTNRNSKGANFDVIYKLLDVNMSLVTGKLTVEESKEMWVHDVGIENNNLNYAMTAINTNADELGPYLINQGTRDNGSTNMDRRYQSYILLYASNKSGNLDISYVENLDHELIYSKPKPVTWLNSSKDDAYPTLQLNYQSYPFIYFCSNRDGDFDIYKTVLDGGKDLLANFSDTGKKIITKDVVLSSAADDKCPFIYNNEMVFTSNRPGGYGGFDLYYSLWKGGKWTEPVNFGPKINTPYDEYRPIIEYIPGFENDFMIFSSNRPGGKGGFDLYYVGVEKRTPFPY